MFKKKYITSNYKMIGIAYISLVIANIIYYAPWGTLVPVGKRSKNT